MIDVVALVILVMETVGDGSRWRSDMAVYALLDSDNPGWLQRWVV